MLGIVANLTFVGKIHAVTVSAYPSVRGHHVIEFSVPKNGGQTLNEIGVFDSKFNMLYYTVCSSLYKPDNVQLDVVYRITKQESS